MGWRSASRASCCCRAEILGDDRVEIVAYDGETARRRGPARSEAARRRTSSARRAPHRSRARARRRDRDRPVRGEARRSCPKSGAGRALRSRGCAAAARGSSRGPRSFMRPPSRSSRSSRLARRHRGGPVRRRPHGAAPAAARRQRAAREPSDPPRRRSRGGGRAALSGGQPASGAEGAAGRPDTTEERPLGGPGDGEARGRDARARARRSHEARELGGDRRPVVARSRATRTRRSCRGARWSTAPTTSARSATSSAARIDDGRGTGGLGLTGPDEGGGGTAHAIGLDGFDVLAHGAGTCDGAGPVRRPRPRHRRAPGGHVSALQAAALRADHRRQRAPRRRGHPAHRPPEQRPVPRLLRDRPAGPTRACRGASR